MDELLDDFIAETRDTLEALTGELIAWEAAPGDRALLDSVFRFFHTMKGSCGFLDLPRFARLSHSAEDLLSAVRDGRIQPTSRLVTAVLAVIDRITLLTDALESGGAVEDDDETLIDALHRAAAGTPEPETAPAVAIDNAASTRLRTVRVPLALLDKLMNGMSDLVLARNEVSRHLRESRAKGELEQSFTRLSGSVADMRDMISLMRMQRIDRLFAMLPRLVRDTAGELGKKIELTVEGGDVDIDREMIDVIRDPITHIIRNAIDHGIEAPADRRAAGKPENGRLRIAARQSGNQILVEIQDDGRGIDIDRLLARAVSKGIVTTDQARTMDRARAVNLIFAPGLSTAASVSEISGRGVGMDVVRTNLEAIGGAIELDNDPGRGLRIVLRMPLTLSIISGLTIRAGQQLFALSRNSVVEILREDNPHISIDSAAGCEIATVRDARFPHARLERILGMAEATPLAGERRCLVIIRPAVGRSYALNVAGVIDHEELVVKPGAPAVMATGYYAGTSLPDSGRPLLLLDASGLAAAIGAGESEEPVEVQEAESIATVEQAQSALLFVDMAGRRRALRLGIVDRMLDVPADRLSLRGGRMRLLQDDALAHVLGMDAEQQGGFVKLLRLSDGTTTRYLAVADVLDIVTLDDRFSPAPEGGEVEGVVVIDGQQVEMLDPFWIFADEAGVTHSAARRARACHLGEGLDDAWGMTVLAPLLIRAGYRVGTGPMVEPGAVMLLAAEVESGAGTRQGGDPARLVRLRTTRSGDDGTIWRHDRAGLLAALAAEAGEAA